MHDSLGDRMKRQYEDRTRYTLPRRTYTILRLDGRAFHTYCRGLDKPFDYGFMRDMDYTALHLCEQLQGSALAFVQSDEISILLTDFSTITTDAWFDANIQKMVSVAASIGTAYFNSLRLSLATFDARVFTIPDRIEVENYFIWRQQDATRNSIQMVAQSLYSHKELHGKNVNEQQELIFRKGQNWNEYPVSAKRGRAVCYRDTRWLLEEPPVFTQQRLYLSGLIPRMDTGCDTSEITEA